MILGSVALAVICWIYPGTHLFAQGARQFRAGVAATDFTPWLGISLAGAILNREPKTFTMS